MDEIRSVTERFRNLLWTSPRGKLDPSEAEDLLSRAAVCGDGALCWSDINYNDKVRSTWEATNHYSRMIAILLTFGEKRLRSDGEYAERMVALLRGWIMLDPKNPNWWHNEIGTPMNIANIILMMYPVLSREDIRAALPITERGCGIHNDAIFTRWTGANLIWGAMNTLRHALLVEDRELLHLASRYICGEISIGADEGIQEDGSFFQHGRRLYSGGYGRSFAEEIAAAAYVLSGTGCAIPYEKLHILLIHILDGLRYMTKGGVLDYAVVGREFSRPGALSVGGLRRTVDLLLDTDGIPRRDELAAYRREMDGSQIKASVRYYPVAAMLCHHFDGIYVGAKMLNNTTLGAEKCNNEGELCYNMSYGTHTTVMRDGLEYYDIDPVWDFARVPGTLAVHESDEELYRHTGWERSVLPSDHFGGAGYDGCGIIYERCEHGGVSLYVTDFAIPHGFVSLGADIKCTEGVARLTVDQALFRGSVTEEGTSVIHNGIRYTPLDTGSLTYECGIRRGSWHRNSFARSDTEVSMPVFDIGRECTSGSYAYMISSAHVPVPHVHVLCNNADCQAIQLDDGSVLAVFHKPSAITCGGKIIECGKGIFTQFAELA